VSYLGVSEAMSVMNNNKTSLRPGKYAFVHFVNQDVFSKCPNQILYRHTYPTMISISMAVEGW